MSREERIQELFRNNKPYTFNKDNLVFQTLKWEKEDIPYDEEDYSLGRRLVIRTFGLTKEGQSVSLEITNFTPFFYLKLPPLVTEKKIREIQFKIKSIIKGYVERKQCFDFSKDLVYPFEVCTLKSLYYFDNWKDYRFLKISFKTDSAKWNLIKALFKHSDEPITASTIKFQTTKNVGTIRNPLYLDVYESKIDTIIRFLHITDINPVDILTIEKSKLKRFIKKSTCQICYSVKYTDIKKSTEEWVAPFRVSSFDIECTSQDGSFPIAERKDDKIIQIGTTSRMYGSEKCFIRHIVTLKKCDEIKDISEDEFVIVESVNTEAQLLRTWTKHIQNIDPDILTGYNIFTFDWKYIYDRAVLLGCVNDVFKLGRFKYNTCKLKKKNLSSSAMGSNELYYPIISGRDQIDLLPVIRNGQDKLSSYKLDSVANYYLKLRKNDLPPSEIFNNYKKGTSDKIKEIAEYCIQDCVLVNNLFDKLCVFINNVGMANVAIVPFGLLFVSGQGIKTFSKIAKECMKQKTAFPTLLSVNVKDDTSYEGAIVLVPNPGIYFNPIAVLDFGSLYPSSIIEYNISYETYLKEDKRNIEELRYNDISYDISNKEKKVIGEKTCIYAEKEPKKGIIPTLLIDILKARKNTKKLMKNEKDPFKHAVLNGQQLALKITANSVYGYLGAKFSDLRFPDMAASTTAVGRHRIMEAKKYTEDNYIGSKVIYGDTDSIFIDLSECKELKGKKGKELLKGSINLGQVIADNHTAKLRKPQVLEYEKTFLPFMIITKKRYAGNKYEFDDTKYKFTGMGLVIKRRDNAPIVKIIYSDILNIIFSSDNIEQAILKAVRCYKNHIKDLLEGNVEMNDLIITKTLKGDYKNPTQITHKVLAQRIADRDPGNAPVSNTRIPYIFIDPAYIKCSICTKKINPNKCKCKKCMNLFCSTHLMKHKTCTKRCRLCFTFKKVLICRLCGGAYCYSHKMTHSCGNISEKILQGDQVEDPNYILKNNIRIDYRYYYDHQVKKPVSQIFDLIEQLDGVDPLEELIRKDNNRKNKNTSIKDFFSIA